MVRHGFWEEAGQPGKLPPVWEEPDRFANYTAANWNSTEKADLAPVVWWVVSLVTWSLVGTELLQVCLPLQVGVRAGPVRAPAGPAYRGPRVRKVRGPPVRPGP